MFVSVGVMDLWYYVIPCGMQNTYPSFPKNRHEIISLEVLLLKIVIYKKYIFFASHIFFLNFI